MRPDHSTNDFASVCLSVRPELSFVLEEFSGEACYIVEDPVAGRFFRIGVTEYQFLSVLDGHTTVADSVAAVARTAGENALTELQAAAFCRWLVESELAFTSHSVSAERIGESVLHEQKKRAFAWLNPICIRVPLFNPERILNVATPLFGWCFGPVGLFVWLVAVAGALVLAVKNAPELIDSGGGLFANNQWVWLIVVWTALKLIHELAHGIACRRIGCETREAGVLFLLFLPLPYVDVTGTWRAASRWQRIGVAAAGMYAEMFLAACAMFVWNANHHADVQFYAMNIMLTASVVTLFFNANPLMRFDGYYMLADFLDIPNLATSGQQWLMNVVRRVFFGTKRSARSNSGLARGIVPVYGCAAFVWRILICVSLLLAAEMLFSGAGVVLAAIAAIGWVLVPLVRFGKTLFWRSPYTFMQRIRCGLLVSAMVCGAYFVGARIHYFEFEEFPAVVDFAPTVQVHSAVNGFVAERFCETGQHVQQGELLVRLSSPELNNELADLNLQIQQSEVRLTRHHNLGELAARKVEHDHQTGLRARLTDLEFVLQQLEITAPSAGIVLTNTALLDGIFVSEGMSLLEIGDPNQRRLVTAIPQSEFQTIVSDADRAFEFVADGFEHTIEFCELERLNPRGIVQPPHAALTTIAGGSLAVRSVQNSTTDANPSEQWQLTSPHFVAHFHLPRSFAAKAAAGQTGRIGWTIDRGPVGHLLWQRARNWLREKRFGNSAIVKR